MWPVYDERCIKAAVKVLRSGKTTYHAGTEGWIFEREYASATLRKRGIALANGTLALELALRAFGITGEVVVPARTFVGTAAAVINAGATPVLCDVDRDTHVVTAKYVEQVMTDRTEALIAVHLGGFPCPMDELMDIGPMVIEDCAQAHGGRYKGRPLGSFGHAAAFSFCGDKIISTGEGGMLVLDDENAYERAWSYKDHGRRRTFERDGTGYQAIFTSPGTNWRMTEVSAALGRVQLKDLEQTTCERRNLARDLRRRFLREGRSVAYDPNSAFYRLYVDGPRPGNADESVGIHVNTAYQGYVRVPLPNSERSVWAVRVR